MFCGQPSCLHAAVSKQVVCHYCTHLLLWFRHTAIMCYGHGSSTMQRLSRTAYNLPHLDLIRRLQCNTKSPFVNLIPSCPSIILYPNFINRVLLIKLNRDPERTCTSESIAMPVSLLFSLQIATGKTPMHCTLTRAPLPTVVHRLLLVCTLLIPADDPTQFMYVGDLWIFQRLWWQSPESGCYGVNQLY